MAKKRENQKKKQNEMVGFTRKVLQLKVYYML